MLSVFPEIGTLSVSLTYTEEMSFPSASEAAQYWSNERDKSSMHTLQNEGCQELHSC
jgi:hypothetical protein